jgi:hypothetical protein
MREVHLPVEVDGAGSVWFRATESLEPSGDAQIAVQLIPSMRLGRDFSVDRASPRLLGNVGQLQDIFHCFDGGLKKVSVTAREPAAEARTGDRVGAFFSGGIDSFYTALRHRHELTDLIFLHGFDFLLEEAEVRRRASLAARAAASELGMNLIEVETDYRARLGSFLHWQQLHGPALAVVALLLQAQLSRVLLPASRSYDVLIPNGSHPLVDPLWSTERIEFIHDATEVRRAEKVAYVADSPLAMRHLRVCWQNVDGAYNCGRCEKCLRTMLSLKVAGALERCETLPDRLEPRAIARLRIPQYKLGFALENLATLEVSGREPELARALRTSLRLEPLRAELHLLRNQAGRARRRVTSAAPGRKLRRH